MKREVVATSDAPRVVIDRVSGDLKVIGWDRAEVAAESDGKLSLAVVSADRSPAAEADSAALGDQPVSMPGAAELGGAGEAAAATGVATGAGDGTEAGMDAAGGLPGAVNAGPGVAAEHGDGSGAGGDAAAVDAMNASGADLDGGSATSAAGATNATTADLGTEVVTVTAKGDVKLFVPHGASLQAESVGGDLSVRGVGGAIMIGEASGDAAFSDVEAVSVVAIRGDLAVSESTGDVSVNRVSGDAAVRQVEGHVALGEVGGDLAVSHAAGDLSAQAGGDAALRLIAAAGRHYSVRAGGDLACALGGESNVTVAAHASSGRLALAVGNAAVERHGPMATIVVGAGEGAMSLDAGGHLALRAGSAAGAGREPFEAGRRGGHARVDFRFDGELGDLESQISEKFESAASALDHTLAGLGLSDEERERVVERVRSAGERVGERAQSRVARAMQKMERHLERVRERAERREAHIGRRGMTWSWGPEHGPHAPHAPHPPQPPRAPRPPMPPRPFDGGPGPKSVLGVWRSKGGGAPSEPKASAPVTDEERLKVLKLVEEGKITPAQAGELLAAMEGQGGES